MVYTESQRLAPRGDKPTVGIIVARHLPFWDIFEYKRVHNKALRKGLPVPTTLCQVTLSQSLGLARIKLLHL